MAEPPQPGSIVRREDAGGPPERRSVLGRLGLGEEPSKRAPYLRAILAGLKDAGAKQLEQIPVLGPLLLGRFKRGEGEASGKAIGEAWSLSAGSAAQ
jgi:hypothetical protein